MKNARTAHRMTYVSNAAPAVTVSAATAISAIPALSVNSAWITSAQAAVKAARTVRLSARSAAKNAANAPTVSFAPTAASAQVVLAQRISVRCAHSALNVWRRSAPAAMAARTVPLFVRSVMRNAQIAPTERCARNAASALTVPDRTASA